MNKVNEKIVLSRSEAIDILKKLEFIIVSLHNIGASFAKPVECSLSNKEYELYCKETTSFIDDYDVVGKVISIRRAISDHFDGELGEDDMDDIEREMQDINPWPFKKGG